MAALAGVAGSISALCSLGDETLDLTIDCVRALGVDLGDRDRAQAALVEVDEETARLIFEEAAVAAETAIF